MHVSRTPSHLQRQPLCPITPHSRRRLLALPVLQQSHCTPYSVSRASHCRRCTWRGLRPKTIMHHDRSTLRTPPLPVKSLAQAVGGAPQEATTLIPAWRPHTAPHLSLPPLFATPGPCHLTGARVTSLRRVTQLRSAHTCAGRPPIQALDARSREVCRRPGGTHDAQRLCEAVTLMCVSTLSAPGDCPSLAAVRVTSIRLHVGVVILCHWMGKTSCNNPHVYASQPHCTCRAGAPKE